MAACTLDSLIGKEPFLQRLPDAGQPRKFVVGFDMDARCWSVILIRKSTPGFMRGLLNGVGGKIEQGETPEAAMTREYQEEAGVQVPNWTRFVVRYFHVTGVMVYFFYHSGRSCYSARTIENEQIERRFIEDLAHRRTELVPDVYWLLPMAVEHCQTGGHRPALQIIEP